MKFQFKMMFLTTMVMGTIISISSPNWIGCWMGIEINLLSFIPILKETKSPLSSESSMKYFLVQALGSSLFIMFILIMMVKSHNMENPIINVNMIVPQISMIMKMGAAPLHFWFIEMIEGLTWINSMILMTWQKISPMMIISYMINDMTIFLFIVMSAIIGSIGGLNQSSIRKILAFSSINHISWMLSSFLTNEMNWISYFTTYSIILIACIIPFMKMNIFYLKQMYNMSMNSLWMKIIIPFNFLSLGGLPPFSGFFPKWIIIESLSNESQAMITLMIIMTLITLYFYIRISTPMMMIKQNKNTYLMTEKLNNKIVIMSFASLTLLSVMSVSFNLS